MANDYNNEDDVFLSTFAAPVTLTYTYDTKAERTGITKLLTDLNSAGLVLRDVQTSQSSLEQIFVDMVRATP